MEFGPAGSNTKPSEVKRSRTQDPFTLPKRKKCKNKEMSEVCVFGFTLRFEKPEKVILPVTDVEQPFVFTGNPADFPPVLETSLEDYSDDEDEADDIWSAEEDEAPKSKPQRFLRGAVACVRPFAQELGEQSRPGSRRRIVPWGFTDEQHLEEAKRVVHPVDRESLAYPLE